MIRYLRWAYAITASLLVVAIVIQFLLAGIGVFAAGDFCNVVPDESFGCGFALHAWFGRAVLSLLFLLVVMLSFAARAPWRVTGLAGALIGLFLLQGLLLFPYYDGIGPRAVSALHVVNGLLILIVALRLAGRARELVAELPRSTERLPAKVLASPAGAKGG